MKAYAGIDLHSQLIIISGSSTIKINGLWGSSLRENNAGKTAGNPDKPKLNKIFLPRKAPSSDISFDLIKVFI